MAIPSMNSISVVIPVYNEEGNVAPLIAEVSGQLVRLQRPHEIIVVDDGSGDATRDVLRDLHRRVPNLVIVELARNFGQTLALQAGLDVARGAIVVTMDGDRQNDPRDIPELLDEIEAGADVVSGWRRDRQDQLLLRKVPSWIANRLIRWVTKVPIRDQGCSLKAYRRDVIDRLDLYGDLHRFIAVLTMATGAAIREVEVNHRPRTSGDSKYGLERTMKVIADLFTVQMLTRFRDAPLRWFAALGAPFLVLGSVSLALAPLVETPSVVPATIGAVAVSTFATSLLCGLLAQSAVHISTARGLPRVFWREADGA